MPRIVIDESRCKGCELCTTVCPFDLIHIADRFNAKGYRPAEYAEYRPAEYSENRHDIGRPSPNQADQLGSDNQCTGCANCAAMCPDVAITVYRARANTHTRAGTRTGKLVPQKLGTPADREYNRGNGRERQTIQADTLDPTAPERR
jgi:2-oxoglutarate ferredoxin oxidoreductase subunit delta